VIPDAANTLYAIVQYDQQLTSVTPGAGNMVCGDNSAPIDSQYSLTQVRWGPFSTDVLTGDGWSTAFSTGLVFTGGATLAVPESGTIS
jgi:hypothetical protein